MAWLLLWRASVLMEYAPHASIWFPPSALTFAAFLVMGLRATPVIALCAILSTFWVDSLYQTGDPLNALLLGGSLFAVAHAGAFWLGAFLLRALVRRAATDALPSIVLSFLLLGAGASLLAALGGSQALSIAGMISPEAALSIWVPWWIGDMAAVISLTPVFIAGLGWRYSGIEPWLGGLSFHVAYRPWWPFVAKLAVLLVLLVAVLLLTAQMHQPEVAFSVFFLIIPQMWIVYTETAMRAVSSVAAFCIMTAVGVAAFGLEAESLIFQFAVTVIAASSYFGLAVPMLVDRNRLLREEAITDGLTRASSRRFFFEQAGFQIMRCRRYSAPVTLVVLDVDHFKAINDRHGHIVGDKALLAVANVVREQLRPCDLFGRFGGDEFMVLLPGYRLESGEFFAERLREGIEAIHLPGVESRLSASFAAVQIEPDETLMAAFGRADERLLAAKRAGRNQVVSSECETAV